MKLGVNLKHKESLALYLESTGAEFPAIPEGKNTVWHHFKTPDGECAVLINQRGFTPTAADNEEQVNGCAIAIALDAPDDATARATLEQWVKETLKVD